MPLYLDLAKVLDLWRTLDSEIGVRALDSQGWSDAQVVMALVLLNLTGGESVDDIELLEADEGLCLLMRRIENHRLGRRERRALDRRWRKERTRTFPSQSSIFRYLDAFHDESEEAKRQPHTAFIPAPNQHLRGLVNVGAALAAFSQRCAPQSKATLDMDATLAETGKESALYCYKKFLAYQPLNVFWHEAGLTLHSEFRDGNVNAGFQQTRVLDESLSMLPPGVVKVFLRTDTAGHEWQLIRYCAEGKNERFGVIEFAIGADVTQAFKKAVAEVPEEDWQPLTRMVKGKAKPTGQEWAEVCFVPNKAALKKHGPEYRFLATREPLEQPELPLEEKVLAQLPFPTMEFAKLGRYKVFGIVTNRDLPGEELIRWHRERCGDSEHVHSEMKTGLAGGRFPSGKFGANAAWWAIMIIAQNLNTLMKRLVLGREWAHKRMKAIRFYVINLAGRTVKRSRRFYLRLSANHPSLPLLLAARVRIAALAHGPPI